MKKGLKILFLFLLSFLLLILAGFAYLNFVYLPGKVQKEGPAYLKQKSKGTIQAGSIQYIPFQGIRLKNVVISSREKQGVFTIYKVNINADFILLLTQHRLKLQSAVYLREKQSPIPLNVEFSLKQQTLNLETTIAVPWFAKQQSIHGKLQAELNADTPHFDLELASADLSLQGNFNIKDNNLYIEKLHGKILDSTFDVIGDIQNLKDASFNIYGNLDLNLTDLQNLNPAYLPLADKIKMEGRCSTAVYLAAQTKNPEIGLKINASPLKMGKIGIDNLIVNAQLKDKTVSLNQCYVKLYDGEVNLTGNCQLSSPNRPVSLDLNISNLELNKLSSDLAGKTTPLHGRLAALSKVNSSLKDIQNAEGKLWLNISGSNILQLPMLKGIADILRLPEMSSIEFKEATGNFIIAQRALTTEDFKIASDSLALYYKGFIDFDGNLNFDIRPQFSPGFFSASPNISNILGIFIDTAGNFLGEIKMKGTIKEVRHTFKPFSMKNFSPQKLIEEGLKRLFKND
ncbi:MAG: AsmA-like C-terminal region-containing protein [Candidatus Omnitrophota bacterium]